MRPLSQAARNQRRHDLACKACRLARECAGSASFAQRMMGAAGMFMWSMSPLLTVHEGRTRHLQHGRASLPNLAPRLWLAGPAIEAACGIQPTPHLQTNSCTQPSCYTRSDTTVQTTAGTQESCTPTSWCSSATTGSRRRGECWHVHMVSFHTNICQQLRY